MSKQLYINNQASATVNYLIFIQNAMINEVGGNNKIPLKFPYLSGLGKYLRTSDEFKDSFKGCWDATIKYRKSSVISLDPILSDRNWDMLSLLFKQNEVAMDIKRKSIDFFLSWWFQPSIGGNALLDHFGIHTMKYIYSKLKSHLDDQYDTYDMRCRLEIVYDELELFPELGISNSIDYVVVSKDQLPDFRFEEDAIKHHPEQLDILVEKLIAASRARLG